MVKLNLDEAAWVEGQPVVYQNGNANILIGNCIPAYFEGYCKILHPFTIFRDVPEIFNPQELLNNRMVHIDSGTGKWAIGKFAGRRMNGEGTPASWNDVSEKYGVTFKGEMTLEDFSEKFNKIGWPENLLFPLNGRVWADHLSIIAKVLTDYSIEDRVRLYQTFPNTIWHHDVERYDELMECTFSEVLSYFKQYFIGYLFSPDRSWVIFTDDDLPYTMVGGPASLIERMLDSPLEILKCDASTVVSYSE